jgi:hypothetical protein
MQGDRITVRRTQPLQVEILLSTSTVEESLSSPSVSISGSCKQLSRDSQVKVRRADTLQLRSIRKEYPKFALRAWELDSRMHVSIECELKHGSVLFAMSEKF